MGETFGKKTFETNLLGGTFEITFKKDIKKEPSGKTFKRGKKPFRRDLWEGPLGRTFKKEPFRETFQINL